MDEPSIIIDAKEPKVQAEDWVGREVELSEVITGRKSVN